jgi:uncharacterized cupredoxin-like copper-binding protein
VTSREAPAAARLRPAQRGLLALVLAAASVGVFAHGDDAHSGPNLHPVATAFGQTGDPGKVSRTIEVRMDDRMRFVPDRIEVKRGETVRLRVANRGQVMHELVIGTEPELREHAELMKRFPNMEHDEPFMAHVAPGRKGEIVWQFTQAGTFRFACLVPGHTWNDLASGMVGTIVVR